MPEIGCSIRKEHAAAEKEHKINAPTPSARPISTWGQTKSAILTKKKPASVTQALKIFG
jgi:hypothetical protein